MKTERKKELGKIRRAVCLYRCFQRYIDFILYLSLINMKILVFMVEGPISHNKGNRNLSPPTLADFFVDLYEIIGIYV